MNKKEVIYGFLIGVIAPLIIMVLFVMIFIDSNVNDGFHALKSRGKLSNIMRLGLLVNLVTFTFIVRKKELFARGIVVATLLILILSLLF